MYVIKLVYLVLMSPLSHNFCYKMVPLIRSNDVLIVMLLDQAFYKLLKRFLFNQDFESEIILQSTENAMSD